MSVDTRPLAILLMGPTASGKTGLAVELAKHFPVDIISVDSALVYRGMDIGTAKPDEETLRIAPHRLIDIRDPVQPYSAAEFVSDALREMQAITANGRIPLLVGGTMLYFRALEKGLSALPAADAVLRKQLDERLQQQGLQALHDELTVVDPMAAQRIHPNDPQRILRALEVYHLTGKPLSEFFDQGVVADNSHQYLKLILSADDRALLHQRINVRFDNMLQAGFLNEVRQLFQREDLYAELPAMRAVGYRQAWQFLAGDLAEDEWVEKAKIATRQYAKRQLTWLRSEQDAHWLNPGDTEETKKKLKLICTERAVQKRLC
ncbi:MAG: tRNA (adenosine(37)-N6)-dimethylallyltransferase MiaA [Gammaproteobacteria bacterium]